MMTKTTVIFGATSILGQKLAQTYGQQGHRLILAGRSKDELSRVASDVRVRYCCQADTMHFDATKIGKGTNLAARIEKKFGEIDNAILVFGDMGDAQNGHLESLEQCIRVNFLGAALLAESIAELMVSRGSGSIIGISSVAGDRGRKKNYHYGSAKGGFTLFLQGLRNRLFDANVHVMTVRLGFMDSRMTYGQKSPIPTADPQLVASRIYQAHQRRNDDIYLPGFWRGIMGVVRGIPEQLFKRLDI